MNGFATKVAAAMQSGFARSATRLRARDAINVAQHRVHAPAAAQLQKAWVAPTGKAGFQTARQSGGQVIGRRFIVRKIIV